jgi:hypothetical protein
MSAWREQGRHQPEEQGRQHGHGQAEQQHRDVEADHRLAGDETLRDQRHQHLVAQEGQQAAEGASGQGQEQVLDQELLDQPGRRAPSEARTAISFSREAARASSMFATLLQAMSSSRPTAAARV